MDGLMDGGWMGGVLDLMYNRDCSLLFIRVLIGIYDDLPSIHSAVYLA